MFWYCPQAKWGGVYAASVDVPQQEVSTGIGIIENDIETDEGLTPDKEGGQSVFMSEDVLEEETGDDITVEEDEEVLAEEAVSEDIAEEEIVSEAVAEEYDDGTETIVAEAFDESNEKGSTVDNPIEISTAGQLLYFNNKINAAELVTAKAYLSKHYKLIDDIDYKDNEWTPGYEEFKGTFTGAYKDADGNIKNHVISNITLMENSITDSADKWLSGAAFMLENSGTIDHLTIENAKINNRVDGSSGAVFVVRNKGTIQDCVSEGTVTCQNAGYAVEYRYAGMCCESYGTIKDCTNNAQIVTDEDSANYASLAGIACSLKNGTIEGCENKGNLSGFTVAGIVKEIKPGKDASILKVIGCANNAVLKAAKVSGICYEALASDYPDSNTKAACDVLIENCTNKGNLFITKGGSGAGMISSAEGVEKKVTIKGCVNEGKLDGISENSGQYGSFAGIVYYTKGSVEIQNCGNRGDITGETAAGIIVSGSYDSGKDRTKIEYCYNTGDITLYGYGEEMEPTGGGIVNNFYGGTIKSCWNSGNVICPQDKASAQCGGIVGHVCYTGNSDYYISTKITDCFNTGNIAVAYSWFIGGIVGKVNTPVTDDSSISVTLERCYNVGGLKKNRGTVPGNIVGGIRYDSKKGPYDNASITDSRFIDNGFLVIGDESHPTTVTGTTKLSDAELSLKASYPDKWDFATVWNEPSAGSDYKYPTLRGFEGAPMPSVRAMPDLPSSGGPDVPVDPGNTDSPEDKEDDYFEESKITKFTLTQENATISSIKAKTYDGAGYQPTVKVTVKKDAKKLTLTEGTDYRVTYANNISAGKGNVIIKGNGAYEGTVTKEFTINPKPVKSLKVVAGGLKKGDPISGEESVPIPIKVYDGGKLLTLDTDYELKVTSGTTSSKGKVTVTVTGKGNYKGDRSVKVTVFEADNILSGVTLTVPDTGFTFTGKPIKPAVTVRATDKEGNVSEISSTYYTVKYTNNVNAGTAFVTVTGKKGYAGSIVEKFTIKPYAGTFVMKRATIADKTYNGKLQKPSVTIQVDVNGAKKTLKKGRDYVIYYTNNLHAGTASVVITGKGNYAASAMSQNPTFTIKPQKITKVKVAGKKDALVLTYAKRELVVDWDYTVKYDDPVGNKVPATITGMRDFAVEGVVKNVKVKLQ